MNNDTEPAIFDALSEPVADRVAFGLDRVSLAIQHRLWVKAFEAGLTATQLRVLNVLSTAEEATGTNALARTLQVSAPTISDALTALSEKALITRERGATDRRATVIGLSDAGRDLVKATGAVDALKIAICATPEPLQVDLLRGLVATIRALQLEGAIPVQRMCVTCRFFRPNIHADPRLPHHCAFVDAPFGDEHLRLDCMEQETAPEAEQQANWARFIAPIRNAYEGERL